MNYSILILEDSFAALGAGNGATFQLVPLRWPLTTAVAGGMIGEIGALGGGILPNLLGQSWQRTGSYAAGLICFGMLALCVLALMRIVSSEWTRTWVGAGGRVRISSVDSVSPLLITPIRQEPEVVAE